MHNLALVLICVGLLAGGAAGQRFDDPLVATVLGTPPAEAYDISGRIDQVQLGVRPFPDRQVPGALWYLDAVYVDLACQDGPAPLVFVIAGTGADYRSAKMQQLKGLFYASGAHVVTISSPTAMDFQAQGSRSGLPGISREDARDLHRVMRLVRDEALERVEITGYLLTGYSLGGLQSAFVAELDRRMESFDFQRVLMINPPVDLWASVTRLDRMITEEMPGGVEGLDAFLQQLLTTLGGFLKDSEGPLEFDEELFYELQRHDPLSDVELRHLIGLSFRLSAADLVFLSDVLTEAHLVVPEGTPLGLTASLTPYFRRSLLYSFEEYFDDYVFPYWSQRHPGGTREQLLASVSLPSIAPFLRRAEHVGVVTNVDDFILDAADVRFLHETFGSRGRFFSTGGHCGNMLRKDFASHVLAFLGLPAPSDR